MGTGTSTIEEMVAAVVEISRSVKHVYGATGLSRHVPGAFLRFPVARPAAPGGGGNPLQASNVDL